MKQTILFAIIVLVAVAVVPLHGSMKTLDEGEFVLFNAEYNTATIQKSQTTIFIEKRLFRINKKTGDTWMLIDNIREGKDVKYWKRIKNDDMSVP